MTAQSSIGQRGRLIILILYLVGLLLTSWAALGSWIPPTSERGIWFYAALAALLLGSLLVTPFFTKPADAIAMRVVREHERAQGRQVYDVSEKNLG